MIPCKDCITLGICRHKGYGGLLQACSFFRRYLKGKGTHNCNEMKREIMEIIRPTQWKIVSVGGDSWLIDYYANWDVYWNYDEYTL